MSSSTQPTDFSDLFTDLQNRVRSQTGVTAVENQAKRAINTALQDLHIGWGERFPWAERHQTLITQDDYNTGTVTISKGSTSLAGTSTLWDTNNDFSVKNMRANGKIAINGGVEVYTISSVTDDTNAVLSSAFVKADVSAGDYVYFEDEYDLHADFLRPIDIQYFDQNTTIELIGRTEFRRRYPRNKTPGKISVATIVDRAFSGSTTPVRRVLFHKPPDDSYAVPYSFVTNKLAVASDGTEQVSLSADADEPIVPLQYRHAIVLHALYHWYRDRKDDERSLQAKVEYEQLLIRITGDVEIGSSRPQLRPRIGTYVSHAKTPYRRRGGRFTLGSAFDEVRG